MREKKSQGYEWDNAYGWIKIANTNVVEETSFIDIEIRKIDECEYILLKKCNHCRDGSGGNASIVHKENCSNPIHNPDNIDPFEIN